MAFSVRKKKTKTKTKKKVRSHHREKNKRLFANLPPEDSSPMIAFLDVKLAQATKQEYIRQLKVFFDFLGLKGLSLDKQSRTFLTQAKKSHIWVQEGLKYYIREAKKRAEAGEIAESTIRNFYKPVRLFCSVHDIELSWKKITDIIPTGRRAANDRAPTVEEIQHLIRYPDRRIGPLVLTTCSSGIRVGAWEYLKWKHIEPIIRGRDDEDGFPTFEYLKWNNYDDGLSGKFVVVAAKITVYAGENDQYFSFITPEAFEALDEWMRYRRTSGGEDINGESWLMRHVWDTTSPKPTTTTTTTTTTIPVATTNITTTNPAPERLTKDAIEQLIKRAWKSQGLRSPLDKTRRRYEVQAVHGFRKFFQTNAEPKMKSQDVMTLMGQDTGLAASYNKPTVEMLLLEYLKAVDNLTIDKTRTKQQQQDKKMVDFATKQQAMAAQLETRDMEVQGLRKQTQILTEAYKSMEDRTDTKDKEVLELKEQMSKMQQDLQEIKEYERINLREGRELYIQGRKRIGKDTKLWTVSDLTSSEMIESLKEYPRVKREAIFEEMITSVKDEWGYDETHPEIKKAREYYNIRLDG